MMQTIEPRGNHVYRQARRIEMEARKLRAEAVSNAVTGLGRGIGRAFAPLTAVVRRVSGALARRREADRIFSQLSRMNDRDLADIGIARSDIVAIAEGTYMRPEEAAGEVVVLRARAPEKAEQAPADLDRAA